MDGEPKLPEISEPPARSGGEARRIDEVLGDLDTGAQVVEVTGETGIGKTRLLAEIARLAGAREIRVFSDGTPPDGALLPFGAFDDAERRTGDVDGGRAALEPYLPAGGPLVVVLDVPAHASGPVGPDDLAEPDGGAAPAPGGPPAGAHRSRRRTDNPALAVLTRRERQVAELAGDGLTNREIAAALFVTEKTVEMHLTNVFAKLDVRNRVGLARRLHAAGRDE